MSSSAARYANIAENGQIHDVIFDLVDTISLLHCRASLAENGHYLLANPRLRQIAGALWTTMTSSRKSIPQTASETRNDLLYLKRLWEGGAIQSAIDRCFPLEEIVDAHR